MTPGIDGIVKGAGDNAYSDGELGGMEPPSSTGAAPYRRGGKCCGCCCDYRRAVLIVDAILWVLALVTFIYEIVVEEHMIKLTAPEAEGDDDTAAQMQDAIADSALLKFSIAMSGLQAFFFLPLSICGALKFKWAWPIGFCTFYVLTQVFGLIISPIFCEKIQAEIDGADNEALSCKPQPVAYIFQTVVIALVLYPHIVFMRQCRRGILTPETYHTREKSCCCSA